MEIAISVLCILIGISFSYKCFQAALYGRVRYWQGFVPLTVISPFLIHLPSKKNTLIKTTQQWWVHVMFGPIFFLLALSFTAYGMDHLGWPGTQSVNYVLTFGRTDVTPAISFSEQTGYRFPFLARMGEALSKIFMKPVPGEEKPTQP